MKAAVSAGVAAALGPSYEVVPAAKLAEERAEPVRQGVGNLRMALVGFAAVRHFMQLPGWEVVGISRRIPPGLEGAPRRADRLARRWT